MPWSDERRAESKAQRDAWRLNGLCICCGRPKCPGMVCCAICVERNRANKARGWKARREAGLCMRCGAPTSANTTTGRSRIYCDKHAEEARAASRQNASAARSNPERVVVTLCRAARGRAVRDGMEHSIQPADLLPAPTMCPILGIPIEYEYRPDSRGPRNNSPSIDRIDNSKGYVKGNVRIVSYRANRLRSDASLEELRAIVLDAEAIAAARQRQN